MHAITRHYAYFELKGKLTDSKVLHTREAGDKHSTLCSKENTLLFINLCQVGQLFDFNKLTTFATSVLI